MYYIGIDVAGLKRQQVIAILDKNFDVKILLEKIKKRDDVVELSRRIYKDYGKDSIIAIDSPRCWSIGPKNIRKCEKEIRQHIKTPLINTPIKSNFNKKRHEWMQVGMWFFEAFGKCRPNVIEVFPSASYVLLDSSRICVKLPISQVNKSYKKDIFDAICAAITGYYYHIDKYQRYGDKEEGYIIVPKLSHQESLNNLNNLLKQFEIEAEEEKLLMIKRASERIVPLILDPNYPKIDIEIEKKKFKELIKEQFPDKVHLYDLIYEPRFKRLEEQFRTSAI